MARRPAAELMPISRPIPRSRICGRTAWLVRARPNMLTSKQACCWSSVKASVRPVGMMPALLTSTSRGPCAMTVAIAWSTDDWSVTSSSSGSSLNAPSLAQFSRWLAASRLRPLMSRMDAKTLCPRCASAFAASMPMPRLAPVMRMVWGLTIVHFLSLKVDLRKRRRGAPSRVAFMRVRAPLQELSSQSAASLSLR